MREDTGIWVVGFLFTFLVGVAMGLNPLTHLAVLTVMSTSMGLWST